MANRTDKEAGSIHGTNPQNLVENIVRQKVYQTIYWKESCFALTAESLIEKAVDLKSVGGTFGGHNSPTHFLCIILKMLQIQPDKEIIVEYIKNEDFKYVRILGAFYMRLVGRPQEVYQYLEPLYNDYRKIRVQQADGNFVLSHMDELVDDMLRKDYMFDIALPRIPKRLTLERGKQLDPRKSALDDDFDEAVLELEAGEAAKQAEEAAAATAAGRDGKAAARGGRDEEEERLEIERAKERQREKWREEPRERRREDRGHNRDRDRDNDLGEGDDYDRPARRDRDRDGHEDRDRGRGRHDREDDRDRRRGGRSRSTSPERDRRRRDKSPERESRGGRDGGGGGREEPARKYANAGSSKGKGVDVLDPEIIAANAERAKLGLKPLR